MGTPRRLHSRRHTHHRNRHFCHKCHPLSPARGPKPTSTWPRPISLLDRKFYFSLNSLQSVKCRKMVSGGSGFSGGIGAGQSVTIISTTWLVTHLTSSYLQAPIIG